ncbi:ferredoxin [Nocardia abscessus]|uniref:ferredoxin n=1 Tax=Nocardia abscessus TaxID=120957 RepID=UPI001894C335|nr:ferredoxin [Nocardia abscessus]MBF6341453.1 ferredoxin [Nocardia abscessus]
MRIRLDRTLCDGFGLCAKHAPAHFSLDDWGYAALEGTGVVAAADQDGVLRALLDCPVHAIIAVPEPETGPPPATSAAQPLGQEPPR